jgi:hypothetical protein
MVQYPCDSVLACIGDMGTLSRFVDLLNTEEYWSASLVEGRKKIGGDYRPIKDELRRLVKAWSLSGPDVSKLIDAAPGLNKACSDFRSFFLPAKGRTGKLGYLNPPEFSSEAKPREVALGLFIPFLLNPYNEQLAGPCKGCDRFFVKRTQRRISVYCSKKCGHRFTSKSANKRRRDQGNEKQLQRAKSAIVEWSKLKGTIPWKKWVSKRTGIKKHWLTCAERDGRIRQPVEKRGSMARLPARRI